MKLDKFKNIEFDEDTQTYKVILVIDDKVYVLNSFDDNNIDCYLLKVNPKGQDLATCVWGDYDIGAALVGAGWAIANTSETDIYAPYEAKAQSELSGLWQGSFYSPEDWRNIKRDTNNFTIKRRSKGGFFNFKSLF